MRDYLFEPLRAPYMQRALVELLVLAVASGVVGTLVFVRRMTFIADAMTHTIFPGVAIAFFAGWSLLWGALAAALVSVAMLAVAGRHRRFDPDAVLAALLTTMFSVGVIVVSRRPSYSADLDALLFGRLLTVDATQIWETAIVALVAVGACLAVGKELVLRAFDPAGAEAMGYSLGWLDVVVNLAVGLVIVAGARAVGTALMVTLLVTPAATARLMRDRIGPIGTIAVAITVLASLAGLVISYDASVHHDVRLPAAATITAVLTVAFVLVAALRWTRGRSRLAAT
jgi:manganese/iron transport system permease protein